MATYDLATRAKPEDCCSREPLPPGTRVRHYGQQFVDAQEGTGVVVRATRHYTVDHTYEYDVLLDPRWWDSMYASTAGEDGRDPGVVTWNHVVRPDGLWRYECDPCGAVFWGTWEPTGTHEVGPRGNPMPDWDPPGRCGGRLTGTPNPGGRA